MTADSGILTENFPATAAPVLAPRARILVLGNEKGGSGKSTVAMHLTVGLLRAGLRVGTIDVDSRQATLTRYLENRNQSMERLKLPLPMSEHRLVPRSAQLGEAGIADETARLEAAIAELSATCQTIVIDTPGSDQTMSRVAHSYADTLITPLNDSFIDFDLLARVDTDGETILGPSVYSEMVWNARQLRAQAGLEPIDWVVVRNRMGAQNMVNKQKMEAAINKLSRRIGFRVAPGFNERVIFRELFPRGLTLLDLRDIGVQGLNISNVAARQELRELIRSLNLPGVTIDF
jgi:chromosome partitioning protein